MSQEHVRILENARKLIASKEKEYICFALGDTTLASIEVVSQISLDLGDVYSFETWLIKRDFPANINKRKLRATRLAWIDALIVYWRDK